MESINAALTSADRPLFVTHRQADTDSLGSALGLQALVNGGTICAPDGVTARARSLVDAMGAQVVSDPACHEYDLVVVLDAPSTERIAPVDPVCPLVIDHHERGDLAERASASLIDTDAESTAELVASLAFESDWPVLSDAAVPLLVGVLDDTGPRRSEIG